MSSVWNHQEFLYENGNCHFPRRLFWFFYDEHLWNGHERLANSYVIHLTTTSLFFDHSSITNFGSILDCKICIENAQNCLKSKHFPNLLELDALEIVLNLFKVTKIYYYYICGPDRVIKTKFIANHVSGDWSAGIGLLFYLSLISKITSKRNQLLLLVKWDRIPFRTLIS